MSFAYKEYGSGQPTLPQGWTQRPLAEIATYSIGRTPPRAASIYWADSYGFPWVAISDLQPFGEVATTAEAVTEVAAREVFNRPPAAKGLLLMSFKLTIGRTSVLAIDAYHNEAIISITPNPDIVERDFLRYF